MVAGAEGKTKDRVREGSREDRVIDERTALLDDPIAAWRWLNERRETLIGGIRARRDEQGDYWTTRAGAIGYQLRSDPAQPPPTFDLIVRDVTPQTTILDVGAGAGRLALPLAARAQLVTAVEPNAFLRQLLQADATTAGLFPQRLQIVAANWEEAEVAPAAWHFSAWPANRCIAPYSNSRMGMGPT